MNPLQPQGFSSNHRIPASGYSAEAGLPSKGITKISDDQLNLPADTIDLWEKVGQVKRKGKQASKEEVLQIFNGLNQIAETSRDYEAYSAQIKLPLFAQINCPLD